MSEIWKIGITVLNVTNDYLRIYEHKKYGIKPMGQARYALDWIRNPDPPKTYDVQNSVL
jgi:hypothetical protein